MADLEHFRDELVIWQLDAMDITAPPPQIIHGANDDTLSTR